MKTIVCERPGLLVMKETEKPVASEGEALVRVRRIGICGTDLHAYKGNQPFFEYPRILGHELSGEVVELGPGTAGLQAGDPVTIVPYLECGVCVACRSGKTNCCTRLSLYGVHQDGGMTEYMAVPADHLLKADGLSLEQAAIVECLGIGAHAVRRAALQPGEHVVVIGAGPIGLGVMKFAKMAGARVIALDINDERLAFCGSWAYVDHTANANDRPLERIREWTGGDLAAAVFDATGNAKSMEGAMYYAANGGRVIFVGLVKADLALNDPEFHRRELTLMSSRNATMDDLRKVADDLRQGYIDTDRFITHRCGFDRMIETYESWLKPETGVIKAVVEL